MYVRAEKVFLGLTSVVATEISVSIWFDDEGPRLLNTCLEILHPNSSEAIMH